MDHRISLIAALVLISTSALAASPPLEFKTLVIGAPTTPEQVEAALTTPCGMSGGTCDDLAKKIQEMRRVKCGLGGSGMQVCNGSTTIAGTTTQVNVVIGSDGLLQRIHLTFSDYGYEDVHQALTHKFGAAQKVSHPTLQNGFGASFRQETSIWNGAQGTQMLLNKYAGDVDHSDVYISTQKDRDLMTGRHAAPSSDL